jgi:hypothetical protein
VVGWLSFGFVCGLAGVSDAQWCYMQAGAVAGISLAQLL